MPGEATPPEWFCFPSVKGSAHKGNKIFVPLGSNSFKEQTFSELI